jgi:hypothetical protein
MLEHLPDAGPALSEMTRVTRRGGLQANGTLSPGQARQWWEYLQHADSHGTLLIGFTAFITVGTRT